MRVVIPDNFRNINIGHQEENEAVEVLFNVEGWAELYGAGGEYLVIHQRPNDPAGYPIEVTCTDEVVTWVLTAADMAYAGYGRAELVYKVDGVVAKSDVYNTLIEKGVNSGETPPDPWTPWVDEVIEARDEAVEAAGNAAQSESNAAESERNASASESNAHGSELAAGGSASSAETSALKSEGYAVGKQNGTPVESGSPYYKNNAAYYAAYANEKAEEVAQALAPINAHIANTNNPHSVTKSQVGLGNVDNTSDLDKPISTATQAALDGKISKVAGAVADNIAVLTAGGEVADSGITKDWLVPVKAKSGSVIEFTSDGAVPLKSALLKGKTAAVNQLFKATARTHSSGVVFSVNADGFAVMNGTAASSDSTAALIGSGAATVNGHAYFVKGGTTSQIVKGRLGSSGTYVEMTDGLIFSGNGNNFGFVTAIVQGTTYNNVVVPVNVIDLTLCGFTSSETADVATLKAAWFAKYGVPLPQYIPYNAGSIVSNNATYRLCGHNLFDGTYQANKDIDNHGNITAGTFFISDYIPVTQGAKYYKSATSKPYYYDINKAFVSAPAGSFSGAGETTVPAGAAYLIMLWRDNPVTNNGFVNYPSTFTTHEPYYDGGSIVADSLNGIGTVADEQDASGAITRRFGVVDLGSLTWERILQGSFYLFSTDFTTGKYSADMPLAINAYGYNLLNMFTTSWSAFTDLDYGWTSARMRIRNDAYTDAATFKAAMSGQYLVFELATPTTDTTTPATLITQKGYNILRTVSGDIQNAPADIEYLNGLAAVIAEAVQ